MNEPQSQLKDFVNIQRSLIEPSICRQVIDEIKDGPWERHYWHDGGNNKEIKGGNEELDIQNTNENAQKLLSQIMANACISYQNLFAYSDKNTKKIFHQFAQLRFNRYSPGQIMRIHIDHISSLFDGKEKGIPVISLVLNFNDQYEGGELTFWGNYKIKLGVGDIVLFPSLFMFPHRVSEITKGVRYSAVSWAW